MSDKRLLLQKARARYRATLKHGDWPECDNCGGRARSRGLGRHRERCLRYSMEDLEFITTPPNPNGGNTRRLPIAVQQALAKPNGRTTHATTVTSIRAFLTEAAEQKRELEHIAGGKVYQYKPEPDELFNLIRLVFTMFKEV